MLPPPLRDLALRTAALDGPLGDRVQDAFTRLVRTVEALAWARDRLSGLLVCGTETEVLHRVVEEAATVSGAPEVWAVRWTGPVGGDASVAALVGRGASDGPMVIGEALRAPHAVSRSLVSGVLRDGRPAWSDDARAEEALRDSRSVQAAALRSVGCLPLGANAVLYLSDPTTPGRFDLDVRARIAALCELAAPFLEVRVPVQARSEGLPGLVGESRPMRELAATVRAFAPMPWPALILGETGTGKESVARAVHALSPRKDRPFAAINCGAIPDELAESLLFGHERGAFTGADRRKEGLVETVGDGTLFLDEVGELSPRVQVKLLRLLQEGTYTRLGGDREMRFTGRVVAATHRAIDAAAARDTFRADLYHRLAACVLRVPALRDRREDVPALAAHLLERSLGELPGAARLELEPAAIRWLAAGDWPGNVRELENTLRGAIARVLSRGGARVSLSDVAPGVVEGAPAMEEPVSVSPVSVSPVSVSPVSVSPVSVSPVSVSPVSVSPISVSPVSVSPVSVSPVSADLASAVDAAQRAQIQAALDACHGNKAAAARRLGVSRQWLYRLMDRWEGA